MTTQTLHPYGRRTLATEPAAGLPDHVVRVVPKWGDGGSLCDLEGCYEPDYQDVIDGTSEKLRTMYLDTKEQLMICQKCVDKGRHLDDGAGTEAARS